MRRLYYAAALPLLAASPTLAADCSALKSLALTNATVTAATTIPAGTAPLKPATDICRVEITAHPSSDSDIRIELWIPQGVAWNGKFMQVGNGGFAGKIPYGTMTMGLRAGYAVAGTDDGHQTTEGTDSRWALHHPEKIVDFGYRAVKSTTDAAKAVLAAYGPAPKRSYFFGCSDGGREALMTAQRYPADFDGIVAGAPAYNWTALMATAGLFGKTLLQPGRALPQAKLPAIQAAALSACGHGAKWIAAPQSCRFDPQVIACKGAVTDQCLTPGEVATVRDVYRGVRNPATGKQLPGLQPGAEAAPNSWADWLLAEPQGGNSQGYASGYFANLVRSTADFQLAQLTTGDLRDSERRIAPILNATSPDLSAFKAHGGKLIQYHGWNDPAISPRHSLAYAAALKAKMGDTSDFYRLYMVPGMLHCSGGASPAAVDWAKQLDAWVDGGKAPQSVIAYGAEGATQTLVPVR
jgi:pimeloyl-ACP methyl ester carboxylesterase